MSVKAGTFTATPWPVNQLASKQELEEILARTATSSRLVILDARSPDRFAGNVDEATAKLDPRPGHIPGAFNAPWNSLLDSQTGILKNVDELRSHYESLCVDVADDVIAYCGSGISACLNIVALEHAGFGHARLFVASWS